MQLDFEESRTVTVKSKREKLRDDNQVAETCLILLCILKYTIYLAQHYSSDEVVFKPCFAILSASVTDDFLMEEEINITNEILPIHIKLNLVVLKVNLPKSFLGDLR